MTLPQSPSSQILSLCTLFFVGLLMTSCTDENQPYFQGYIEGEYLFVSSALAGKLETLLVSRGKQVTQSTPLFILDQAFEQAAVAEAEQGVKRAENRMADISKGLRPSELRALEAKLKQALAAYDLSRIEFDRRNKLLQTKVISKKCSTGQKQIWNEMQLLLLN